MADLFSVLQDLSAQLPGCKMVSIVDLESGMQLASVAEGLAAGAAGADAFQSELHRKVDELVPTLDCDGPLESVVLESDETTFIAEPIGETGYFWHVATSADTTLGFTQAIMRKYRNRILESVSALVGD
jgi:predicted regulator of Ras-like GTPase activity (Roadblock/LC7/MglB family)